MAPMRGTRIEFPGLGSLAIAATWGVSQQTEDISLCIFLPLYIYLSFQFKKKKTPTEIQIFYLLGYSPHDCNSKGWARQRSGVKNTTWALMREDKAQALLPSPATSQSGFTGSWTGSRASETQTTALMWDVGVASSIFTQWARMPAPSHGALYHTHC